MNSLLIVDGNSIASRAFYVKRNYFFSLIDKVLSAKNGRWPDIDGMVVVFDDPYADSWRKELYPDYKMHRTVDVEKRQFIDKLYDTAVATGVAVIRWPEADDAIASLAANAWVAHRIIYSGDKDMFALVGKNVHLVGFEQVEVDGKKRWEKVIYDLADIKGKFATTPQLVMDYKALAGDSSDNIPGVKGIGDKVARRLLEQYGSLAGIYDSLEFLSPALKKKLVDGEEMAILSQRLARMDFAAPVGFDTVAAALSVSPQVRAAWATAVLS